MSILLTTSYALLLLGAAAYDVIARRVPNWIVLSVLAISLTASITNTSTTSGVVSALFGVAVGLMCWIPFWVLGLLGAGDVKLFAAASAWIGASLSWRAAIVAAVLGGIYAVVLVVVDQGLTKGVASLVLSVKHGRLSTQLPPSEMPAAQRGIPYAVPMIAAIFIAVFMPARLYQLFPIH